ncbi:hypothetical protein [Streptomyces sp. NPDC093269]|uniref:hypothetical protein n=1 Tax=Streptomyces sp. NPDC093269 TaxID=3366038 RepID=UPI0038179B32
MANGDNEDNAATLLWELHEYIQERRISGPEGHSYISSAPRGTVAHPGLPYDSATDDYVRASVQEVVEHTRSVNPDAGLPPRVQDTYAWMREHTEHAPEEDQFRSEVIAYRQSLEHAIRIGDDKVVRPHRCPKCRTFGLMWMAAASKAVCTNTDCSNREGLSSRFTLARLAHEHVTARKKLRNVSAT